MAKKRAATRKKAAKTKRPTRKKATTAKAAAKTKRAKAKRPTRKKATTAKAAAIPELQAEPLTEPPAAPDRLGTHGLGYWRRIAPLLVELRLLTALHLDTLEILCHWYDVFMVKHVALSKNPSLETFETDSGYQQKTPAAAMRDKAYEHWTKLLPRFGLTPEALKKLKRLKEPAAGSGRSSGPPADPVAAFAASKYDD